MGALSLNCCSQEVLYSAQQTEKSEINKQNARPEAKNIYFNSMQNDHPSTMGMSTSFSRPTQNPGRLTTQFIIDDLEVAVSILLSQNYYSMLNNYENEEELLKPLEKFSNVCLIQIVYQLFNISSSLIETAQTKKISELYNETLGSVFCEDSYFDTEMGETNDYIKLIANLTEIFHYFRFWLSGQKGVYQMNYWDKIDDKEKYFTGKIYLIQNIAMKLIREE